MIVLFDLNGTLTDPGSIGEPWGRRDMGAAVLRRAVETAMVDVVLGQFHPFSEHIRGAVEIYVDQHDLDSAGIGAALERAKQLRPFPGVPQGLGELAAAGHRLAVLTNSGADAGRATLEAADLAGRFDEILGVDAVRVFKPHRRVYEYALDKLGTPADDVVMVAAHAWDLAGANHAGLRTAWIARGAKVFPSLWPAPDLVAPELPELARALNQYAP